MGGSGAADDGLQAIGAILRGILGQPRLRTGVALGRLATSWEAVVGPRLAPETEPRALESGALLVAASSAGWAAQVRFLSDDIRRRANQALGRDDVVSVRVTVAPQAGKSLRPKGSGGAGSSP
jgi:predicted nucleic acid-binding Zn ribbon protein